jgi:hypothetical protein
MLRGVDPAEIIVHDRDEAVRMTAAVFRAARVPNYEVRLLQRAQRRAARRDVDSFCRLLRVLVGVSRTNVAWLRSGDPAHGRQAASHT